jgi:hypothetical protein
LPKMRPRQLSPHLPRLVSDFTWLQVRTRIQVPSTPQAPSRAIWRGLEFSQRDLSLDRGLPPQVRTEHFRRPGLGCAGIEPVHPSGGNPGSKERPKA